MGKAAMFKKLGTNVMFPLFGRVGTAAATWLVSLGADSDLAAQVSVGIIAALLIGLDLCSSWLGRMLRERGWTIV
ncbi:hypothetical protein [Tortoise microvirus 77]|nr:hypothetical protein [Tortoise microvirus 77]